MKRIFKILLFIIIFLIILVLLSKFLWLPKTPISSFYDEKKNSLDTIYIGASTGYTAFNAPLAFQEYGYATGIMAYNFMPFSAIKSMIKESLKYQNPDLFIIDIMRIYWDVDDIEEGDIRNTTDSMKFSLNRIETINKILKEAKVPLSKYFDYYFSFSMYHDVWKDENAIKTNIYGNKTLYKGYLLTDFSVYKNPQDTYQYINTRVKLPEENEKNLLDLLDYIKSKNLNVLFVVPSRVFEEKEEMERLNEAIKIIRDKGYTLLDFNNLEDFKLDLKTDFYNSEHANVYGSTKYTLYLGKYIEEHYDLKDHRGDKEYESWNKEYERFKEDFNKLTEEDFDKILEEDKELGYNRVKGVDTYEKIN